MTCSFLNAPIVKPLPELYHDGGRQAQTDRKKRLKKAIWIILLAVLIIELLFDPLTNLFQWSVSVHAQANLPSARQKWDSQGIVHYKFHIRGAIPMTCLFGGTVEVMGGQIIQTSARSGDLDLGFSSMKDPPLCNYKNYTMPRLLDEIQRSIDQWPFSVAHIAFDPKYGFVSHFGFSSCGGHGLLSPRISDCSGGFTIEDFQVLGE